MTVLVTGGTGFISSRLARKLVEQGENVDVFALSEILNSSPIS